MRWRLTAFILMFLVSLAACETLGPDSNSSADALRSGALKIEPNRTVMDNVSCVDGDKTDWKFFSVPGPSKVAVTFAFDEPSAGGTVVIHNASGETLKSAKFVPGKRMTMDFDAVKSHYYLEIFCEAFKSEYTLEVTFNQ